jgi:carboxymethylenebutenolidase
MPQWIEIGSTESPLAAWEDAPAQALGGIVLIQEIFGVNPHIRGVASRLAQAGWHVLAPCVFDPVERGVELGYDESGVNRGRDLVARLGWDRALAGIASARDRLARTHPVVACMGFCWGGSLAWLAACRLDLKAVCYYGRHIVDFVAEQPHAPVMLHFGERDPLIPLSAVETIRNAHPALPLHVYPAGHGFNCEVRADYAAEAAALAWQRSLDFLDPTAHA